MRKVNSILAFLLLFAGAAWFNAACNKDADATASAVAPTEEVVVSPEGDGAVDRAACSSPCSGYRRGAYTGSSGPYILRIYNRACPGNAWSLVGSWDQNTWQVIQSTSYPFNIEHSKQYMIEATNPDPALSFHFGGFTLYNTWTNMKVGAFNVGPGQTHRVIFSSIGNCNCEWVYNCGPGNDDE